ncbi:energy transducer TonB [Flavobacterium sp. LaA7.5]|nr:energy transducer TonB [Flavobacterium salilacus subsp. altitudinum]
MSKVSVFDQGWIDLVFEGRNKQYGAYQLRQEQSRTTIVALISGIALILALVSIPAAINYFNPQQAVAGGDSESTVIEPKIIDEIIYKIPEQPKPKAPEPNPQQAAAPARTPEPTIRLRPVVAVSTPVIEEIPNTQQAIAIQTSSVTSEGDGSNNFSTGVTSPTGIEGGTGTEASGGMGTIDSTLLEEAPVFPGGMKKFYEKVGRSFNIPETGNATTLKVYVSFVVEKDGTMSNIQVLRDPGYGAGEEAIRVLKSIKTKWKAGKMKGKPVRTSYNLPITLNIK